MAQKRGFDLLLTRQYDKAIAVVVLIALLLSLFQLARSTVESKELRLRYEEGIRTMRPKYPLLLPQATTSYERALRSLRHPQTARPSTNEAGLFIPQSRVWCMECQNPIPQKNSNCPFCHAKNVSDPEKLGSDVKEDSEGLGIPDVWRKKHFKRPFALAEDRSRAEDDADSDGFSNKKEFQAETNPRDPKDHPDIISLLRCKEIHPSPFPFVLTSANKMHDGWQPIFNIPVPGEGARTWFAKKGEPILKTGLIYTNCTKSTEVVPVPGIGLRPVDRYEVHLLRPADKKSFVLRDNDPHAMMEQELVLTLTIAGQTTEYRVSTGNLLELDGQKYRAEVNLVIDDTPPSVVLENIHTGMKSNVIVGAP